MDNNKISQKIHDAWNNFSYDIAMKSDTGKFTMTDISNAFYKGVDTILAILNINLDK